MSICDFGLVARQAAAIATLILCSVPGCAQPASRLGPSDAGQWRRRAVDTLKVAIAYPSNPVVRAEAVEALESVASDDIRPWIRSAMLDEHPGVRFAACMAVGRLRDASAESGLRTCLGDSDPSVRVGALFGLHRLGYTEESGRLSGYLLFANESTVRRNAALAISLLDRPSAVRLLAAAMKDSDSGVREHALEGMARLGNNEARQELAFMANSGIGSEEVFALNALASTGDPVYEQTFRYKLATAPHLETRLAAARGLGKLGVSDGLAVALEGLRLHRAPREDSADPDVNQLLRIHQLAAGAAGAIGREEVLPALIDLLDHCGDARVEVSAARAIVDILAAARTRDLPFAAASPARGR